MAKATKQYLAKSRRNAKIDKHLERKDAIQEEAGIITSTEVALMEKHKKKLAEDATIKVLAGKDSEEILEDIILKL